MCIAAMLASGMIALIALGIFCLLLWAGKLLFGEPPFIFQVIEAYLTIEIIVIFGVTLVGFVVLFVRGKSGKKGESH